MEVKLKKTIKYILLFAILSVFIFFSFIVGRKIYESIPTGFEKRVAKGPHFFLNLLEDGKYMKGLNSDPYISSAYRPEDKLYEPLLAVQQGRWDEARELLEPLVMAGDTTAMFWLAEISYSSGAFSGTYGATLFKKAAKLGNPYAALKLDSDNKECQRFMGRYCSKEWGDLAEKLLEERVANGDYKARYALSLYRGRKTEKDYDEAAEIAIESAKNNYLAPLVSIALWHRDVNDKEVMEIEKEVLKLILSNHYPPALTILHYSEYEFSQEFKESIYETYPLIVGHRDLLIREYYGNEYQGDRDVLLFSLAASMLSNTYKNKNGGGLRLWEFERKYLGRGNSFTKEELDKANTIFEKMKKESTPVIYIDEVEPRKYL